MGKIALLLLCSAIFIAGVYLSLECYEWAGAECSRVCGEQSESAFCECNTSLCILPLVVGTAIAAVFALAIVPVKEEKHEKNKTITKRK